TRKPAGLVNIATLTGSIVAALNDEYAGLFARDDSLASAIATAGKNTGEEVWRMPLHKNYGEDMNSDIAGVNWADRSDALTPKGASGWGVRILDELARNWKPAK
ncbi:MAG: leucyl aminopeptidase, partial [Sphingomonadales bacterium]